MTPESARSFRDRWKDVRSFELEELRSASVETRLRIGAALMRLAMGLGRFPDPEADPETAVVRRRWNALKNMRA